MGNLEPITKLPRWRPTRISTIFRDKKKLWTADKMKNANHKYKLAVLKTARELSELVELESRWEFACRVIITRNLTPLFRKLRDEAKGQVSGKASSLPRPGEVTMKEWRHTEAARLRLAPNTIAKMLEKGRYPNLSIRRVRHSVVFVRVGKTLKLEKV